MNRQFLGFDNDNMLIEVELKNDIISSVLGYRLITKEETYYKIDDFLVCWMTGGDATLKGNIKIERGMNINDISLPKMTKKLLKTIDNSYIADGGFCEECGVFHNDDDQTYVITDNCEMFCKDCVKIDDLLVSIKEPSDIFRSKDIEGMVTTNLIEVETLFCDSSGFDNSGRSMTKDQAENRVNELIEEHGELKSGLTGIGQFQVYVTLYKAA